MKLAEIIDLDKKYYMNTFGDRLSVVFHHGEGSTLYDIDGKAYTDFLGGIAVNALGYSHPKLTSVLCNQVKKLIHCSNLFYIEEQALLAESLIENSCFDRAFIANSGAEANEGAIKLARRYFSKMGMNKYEIITAQNSFHGRTLATVAATGQQKYQEPFKPMPKGFVHVPFNDLDAASEAITENTCAIMIEVIQGEGGVIEGTMEYVKGIEKLCRDHGLLLIIDEVQTGMGRTGKLFGFEHYGVMPDIITLAKALGGGVPIGAVLARGKAAEAFEPGNHGSTFGGNPLACAAAHAVLNIIKEEKLLENCTVQGDFFKNELLKIKDEYPFVKDVRGKGLMLGLELDPAVAGKEIVLKALEKGFIINCAAHNTLRFLPPLIITRDEIKNLLAALNEIFMQYL